MKIKNRSELIDVIADRNTENTDLKDLMQYYYDAQVDYLDDLSDEELLEAAEWAGVETDEFEVE